MGTDITHPWSPHTLHHLMLSTALKVSGLKVRKAESEFKGATGDSGNGPQEGTRYMGQQLAGARQPLGWAQKIGLPTLGMY